MRLRGADTQTAAVARAGQSLATGRRIERDLRPPSARQERRRYRPAPIRRRARRRRRLSRPGAGAGAAPDQPVERVGAASSRSGRALVDADAGTARGAIEGADGGAGLAVMFREIQQSGRSGLSDFTEASDLGVVAGGGQLDRLYNSALACSGFEHIETAPGGVALPGADERPGQCPSPARRRWPPAPQRPPVGGPPQSRRPGRRRSDEAVRGYGPAFGTAASLNGRGLSHEIGAIESRHGHARKRLAQGPPLSGSDPFDGLDAYRAFAAEVVGQDDRRRARPIAPGARRPESPCRRSPR